MPRRNVWYDPATDTRLTALARARRRGRGAVTGELLAEVAGGRGRVAHEARQWVAAIQAAERILAGDLSLRRHTQTLADVRRAAAELAALLAPAARPQPPPAGPRQL